MTMIHSHTGKNILQVSLASKSFLLFSYYDSYCLCDLSREKKLETFSVAMLKDMLKYFEIPFSSRDRKKILVANLSEFLEGCDCNQPR